MGLAATLGLWAAMLPGAQAYRIDRYTQGRRLEELLDLSHRPSLEELERAAWALEDPTELQRVAADYPESVEDVFAVLTALESERRRSGHLDVTVRSDFALAIHGSDDTSLMAGPALVTWQENGCTEWLTLERGHQTLFPGPECRKDQGWALHGWHTLAQRGVGDGLYATPSMTLSGGMALSLDKGPMGAVFTVAFLPSTLAVKTSSDNISGLSALRSVGPTVLAGGYLRGFTTLGWGEARISFGVTWLDGPQPLLEGALVSTVHRTRCGPRIAVRWSPALETPVVEVGLEGRLRVGHLGS